MLFHAAINCVPPNPHSAGPTSLYAFGIWIWFFQLVPSYGAKYSLGSSHSPFQAAYNDPLNEPSAGPVLVLPPTVADAAQLPLPFQRE